MTRDEILALEGEALWEAALHLCGLPIIEAYSSDEAAAFAILRAVRGWDVDSQDKFEMELLGLTAELLGERRFYYLTLEPHHIARAALLARSGA